MDITVTWSPNLETDVVSYKLYRAFRTSENMTALTTELLSTEGLPVLIPAGTCAYLDRDLPLFDGEIVYDVSAIDRTGNESNHATARIVSMDLTPPDEPAHLALATQASVEAGQRPFVVLDSLLFLQRPAAHPTLTPLTAIYSGALWDSVEIRDTEPWPLPSTTRLQALTSRLSQSNTRVVLHLEHWSLHPADRAMFAFNMSKYLSVLHDVAHGAPGLSVGYHGQVPSTDYWRTISGVTTDAYATWQAEQDLLQPLADMTSALYPSLETFYNDPALWVTYATETIKAARRLAKGKPVYAVLNPFYHESNLTLKGSTIDPTFWALELNTLRLLADGIVLWGGWNIAWDETAPWWETTKVFFTTL